MLMCIRGRETSSHSCKFLLGINSNVDCINDHHDVGQPLLFCGRVAGGDAQYMVADSQAAAAASSSF
ncbi:unnamed protein product [Linum trigynum]|uniref:Uncharacterized protein n=1 Tax=Linum trigynum TaxID=586398 RepID=A0AAV2D5V7_9ROSI